jgi:CBS domain containing-hemolysin-like protein
VVDTDTFPTVRVRDLVRPPLLIPEMAHADEILERMRETTTRMAVVIDEFGGTAGIVTLENLVERLVGALQDEFERPAEPQIRRLLDGSVAIDGLVLLSDLEEQFGLHLEETEADTIGGYVLDALGHLPAAGETLKVDGHQLRVAAMAGRRIAQLVLVPDSDGLPADGEDLVVGGP